MVPRECRSLYVRSWALSDNSRIDRLRDAVRRCSDRLLCGLYRMDQSSARDKEKKAFTLKCAPTINGRHHLQMSAIYSGGALIRKPLFLFAENHSSGATSLARLPVRRTRNFSLLTSSIVTWWQLSRVFVKSSSMSLIQSVSYRYVAHSKW